MLYDLPTLQYHSTATATPNAASNNKPQLNMMKPMVGITAASMMGNKAHVASSSHPPHSHHASSSDELLQ